MYKTFCVLIIFCVTGCHWFKRENEPKPSNSADFDALRAKYELYKELTPKTFDDDGFILTEHCDALLHTSLLATTGVIPFDDLLKARDSDGRWFRRPSKDCLSTGSSKSSISRDMLLGLMHAIMILKEKKVINELTKYASDKNWVMGEHDGSIDGKNRVLLTPGFYNLMIDLRDWLHGSLDIVPPEEEEMEQEREDIPLTDEELKLVMGVRFTDHLDALSNEIRGTIYGGLTDAELDSIKRDLKEDPNNALYSALVSKYTNGNQKHAVDVLLREDLFPADRLPTSAERCNEYLWMHGEKPKDWGPCDEGQTHPGHDFLFVARIILEDVEE